MWPNRLLPLNSANPAEIDPESFPQDSDCPWLQWRMAWSRTGAWDSWFGPVLQAPGIGTVSNLEGMDRWKERKIHQ